MQQVSFLNYILLVGLRNVKFSIYFQQIFVLKLFTVYKDSFTVSL
jgi:hypothetical protein